MKSSYCTILFLLLITSSCKINQKRNGLKEGKWISTDTINEDVYKYVERYKKGEEVKTWKTFKNKKIYSVEKHQENICYITYYDANKNIVIKGQTKTENSDKDLHWFYFGDWLYFNENGKLVLIKNYERGTLKSEIEIP